jgi:hypothetical protein
VQRQDRQRTQRYDAQTLILQVGESLKYGLAEPAIVYSLNPLWIGVYSNELDAVAFLSYSFEEGLADEGLAEELVRQHNLYKGSRLLAVNTFLWLHEEGKEGEEEHFQGYAPDLRPGPGARGKYGTFAPLIADFLATDASRVEYRKAAINQSEWQRCSALMEDYFTHVEEGQIKPRDGRPLLSDRGYKQMWLPGHAPTHAPDYVASLSKLTVGSFYGLENRFGVSDAFKIYVCAYGLVGGYVGSKYVSDDSAHRTPLVAHFAKDRIEFERYYDKVGIGSPTFLRTAEPNFLFKLDQIGNIALTPLAKLPALLTRGSGRVGTLTLTIDGKSRHFQIFGESLGQIQAMLSQVLPVSAFHP